jgi:hypothetical protein
MTQPAYAAARAIAARIETHFGRHLDAARDRGDTQLAAPPTAATVETIVDAAFWASLRREEGVSPKISLAYVAPTISSRPLTFERWLPLSPAGLAKLAPAVERPGIHLGVWHDGSGELGVWGTTRELPAFCFVLEVVASGLMVVKHRGDVFGKFVNVAVLEGDQIKVVDEFTARRPDCPHVVASLLGVELPGVWVPSVHVLVQLAASMRAHGRGGALLLIPSTNHDWTESIVTPVVYSVHPPFSELAALVRADLETEREPDLSDRLRRAVDALAGLTAVDGATLISEQYDLFAFGAKISRRRGSPTVERLMLTEPVEGSARSVVTPSQMGGTRHLSAAQFVHDQRDATALVASQDGRFTIFKWSPGDELVHAHRVEALLL